MCAPMLDPAVKGVLTTDQPDVPMALLTPESVAPSSMTVAPAGTTMSAYVSA